MFLRDLFLAPFWSDWIDRFESQSDGLITPNDPVVKEETEKIGILTGEKHERANHLWVYVNNHVRYKLSKQWKKPSRTLAEGVGDCEDLDFLVLSLFPHYGITDGELVIGVLKTQTERPGLHTWVELDGRVIDPTGLPNDVKQITYDPYRRFRLNYSGFKPQP